MKTNCLKQNVEKHWSVKHPVTRQTSARMYVYMYVETSDSAQTGAINSPNEYPRTLRIIG